MILVTNRKEKVKETEDILGFPIEQVNLNIPEIQSLDVVEVSTDKAKKAYAQLKEPLIVDDTSLCINALNGLPGTFITWFVSQLGTEGIIKCVESGSSRKAQAITCISYADAEGKIFSFLGTVSGKIAFDPLGEGFGYDSIFIPCGYTKTFGELTKEEKNIISMRSIALNKFKNFLKSEK